MLLLTSPLPRLMGRLVGTWLAVIRHPGAFFSRLEDAAPALPFALLVYVLSFGSCFVFNLWALGHHPVAIALGGVAGAAAGFLGLALWVGLGGLLFHFGLGLAGAGGRPLALAQTHRCLCYASAPLLLAHVPYLGLPLGLAWALVLGIVGVSKVQRVSVGTALLGVAFPVAGMAGLLMLAGVALGVQTVPSAPSAGLLSGESALVSKLAGGRPLLILWSEDDQGVVRLSRLGRPPG